MMRTFALSMFLGLVLITPVRPDALLQEIDALYEQRSDAAKLSRSQALLDSALQSGQKEFEVLWRGARHWHWVGDASSDKKTKKAAGAKVRGLAEAAISKAPGRVEGYFFAALGIGLYSQGTGVVTAIREGLERKFLAAVDKSIAIDPTYSHGGPTLAKGRFYYLLPWPKRDLEQAEKFLRQSLESNPEALRARYYLSEVRGKRKGREAEMAELARILEGDGGYDRAEAGLIKTWAQERYADLRTNP